MATDDITRAARALRADRERGAMQLAMQAVEFTAALCASDPGRDRRAVVQALAAARPSMAAIANAVALFAAPYIDPPEDAARTVDFSGEAARRLARWQLDDEELRLSAERHIPETILTYSNSSTTRNLLRSLAGRLTQVIVPEGRPIDDGKRLAHALAEAGIPVTLITEAQMGAWLPQVGAVLVGADTIMPDGSLINHMGTATLALLAEEQHIPLISVAHTLKIAPYFRLADTEEENDPTEIWSDPPPGVTIRNLAFDRTPAERVTIITEYGVLTDEVRDAAIAAHRDAWIACGLVE